jgi:hypothetical protein
MLKGCEENVDRIYSVERTGVRKADTVDSPGWKLGVVPRRSLKDGKLEPRTGAPGEHLWQEDYFEAQRETPLLALWRENETFL